MRSMWHPDRGFEPYRPMAEWHKAKLREAQRRRIGNLPGHSTVYGVQVPEEHIPLIRERAVKIAGKKDYAAAQAFVRRAKEAGWTVRGNVWSDAEIVELGERWRAGETGAQIGVAMGRTRCAILGKVNRLGLRRPPPGTSEVPAHMIRDSVAGTLGLPNGADDRSPVFRAAMALVAPMFVAWTPHEIARWTGYSRKECAAVIYTMTTNGIWKGGKPDLGRYMQGGGEGGLQMGDMTLVLDALLCTGEVRCEYGGEMWHAPR